LRGPYYTHSRELSFESGQPCSQVNLERAETFIQTIGAFEDTIFQKRMRDLRRQKERVGRQRYQKQQVRGGQWLCGAALCVCVGGCGCGCVGVCFVYIVVCVLSVCICVCG